MYQTDPKQSNPQAQEIKKKRKKGKKKTKQNRRKKNLKLELDAKKENEKRYLAKLNTWAFLSFTYQTSLHPVFSPFWGENLLVGLGNKNPGLTIIFPSPHPNQTPFKKFSLLIFSPYFFHPP